ncbi:MAG: MlrC C-terminal domain-containing protein, partial [Thermomicrobiales bacterium]
QPLPVRGHVASLHTGDPVGGDIAVLQAGGVQIILTSRRKPYHHRHDFTDLGLDPATQQVVAVKIGYLEPELRALARGALLALTPGAVNQDIPSLPYRRVSRPMYPLDPDMPDPDFDVTIFQS